MDDDSQSAAIPIVHEEAHFMLVNKPAGLFTQAAPGVPSLELQLAAQLKHRDHHPGNPFVGLPHRLDRATSGILLVARNKRALAKFGQQFQSRKVDKYYVAVVQGEMPPGVQAWDDYMRKIEDQPQAEIVTADDPLAKLAQLRIEPLEVAQGRSLVLVQLLTGRMHQIRLQAAHRGWPISGDGLYGPPGEAPLSEAIAHEKMQENTLDETRQLPHALHAYRLRFRHPQTAVAVSYGAPIPAAWSTFFPSEHLETIGARVDRSELLRSSESLPSNSESLPNSDA
jgi:23S rRNA pseudouridine1911/1915/1917 synthase